MSEKQVKTLTKKDVCGILLAVDIFQSCEL